MTVSEFFSMGGYASYVWTSVGVTAVLMAGEIILLRNHHRSTIKKLQRMARAKRAS